MDLTPRTAVVFVFLLLRLYLHRYDEFSSLQWSSKYEALKTLRNYSNLFLSFGWATLPFSMFICISLERFMQENWHNYKQSPFCWQLMNYSFYWTLGVDESMRLYPHVACSLFNMVFTIKDWGKKVKKEI